jgi:NAD(P) transhydrogenase
MVGATERELTRANVPSETGIAKYEDVARGQIVGDRTGTMKRLFHPESLKLLGVHVIGENVAELIHIGQAVLTLGGTIEYFRDTPSTTRPWWRPTRSRR